MSLKIKYYRQYKRSLKKIERLILADQGDKEIQTLALRIEEYEKRKF